MATDPYISEPTVGGATGGGGDGNFSLNCSSYKQLWSMLQHMSPLEREHLVREHDYESAAELMNILEKGMGMCMPYVHDEPMLPYIEYRIHKAILLYLPPLLVIIGTFGNIFSFIILRRRVMSKLSTYIYLAVLSLADTFVLYVGLMRMWVGELAGFDLRDQHDWLCKITVMLLYISSDYSVWLIIAVTVERYIVVCHPLKASSLCNNSRAKKVIFLILFLTFAINVHFLWTIEIHYESLGNNQTKGKCLGTRDHEVLVDQIWPWVDAVLYSFLPFVVIMVLNILIIRQVLAAHRGREELQSGSSFGDPARRDHSRGDPGTKLTVMLLTVSFTFLVTTLPVNISLIITTLANTYSSDHHQMARFTLARTVTEMLMYVNHSINFFLYCATGQKFRQQVMWIMCKKGPLGQASTYSEHSVNSCQTGNHRNGRRFPKFEMETQQTYSPMLNNVGEADV